MCNIRVACGFRVCSLVISSIVDIYSLEGKHPCWVETIDFRPLTSGRLLQAVTIAPC